jgi:hypothetical protein
MMLSFVVAGLVCASPRFATPNSWFSVRIGHTYSYAVLGNSLLIVGWALILEYTVAASAVTWLNYFVPDSA